MNLNLNLTPEESGDYIPPQSADGTPLPNCGYCGHSAVQHYRVYFTAVPNPAHPYYPCGANDGQCGCLNYARPEDL